MRICTLWTYHTGRWLDFRFECTGTPSKRRQPSTGTRDLLFRLQRGKCAYCKRCIKQNPANFDCDHILPVSVGGRTCLSNLHLLCVRCHREKSARERAREWHQPKETQTMKTLPITPKSIPRVAAKADGIVYIADEGVAGSQYNIKYGIPPDVKPNIRKKTGSTRLSRRIQEKFQKSTMDPQVYFKTKLTPEQVSSFQANNRAVVNMLNLRPPRGMGFDAERFARDHRWILELDKGCISRLLKISRALGFKGLCDRETFVVRSKFDNVKNDVISLQADVTGTGSQGKHPHSILRQLSQKMVGLDYQWLRYSKAGVPDRAVYRLRCLHPEWELDDAISHDEARARLHRFWTGFIKHRAQRRKRRADSEHCQAIHRKRIRTNGFVYAGAPLVKTPFRVNKHIDYTEPMYGQNLALVGP